MKYIGPFLRISSINKDSILSELFHLSKESLKHIVLNSKCGIAIPLEDLKDNSFSNNDINIIKEFSPLLCLYKKADSKLIDEYGNLVWNGEKFKKEVNSTSNAFMTLALLELLDYYNSFETICKDKYMYYKLYMSMCKNQLLFYASYLRNAEGVFVDKLDTTETFSENIVFEDKNKKFKFSDQALFMAAYYKYSCYGDKYSEDFKKFSLDILNMFLDFKEDLYTLSLEELNKICFGLNAFYNYSKDENAKLLLLDVCDLLVNKYQNTTFEELKKPIEDKSLLFINLTFINGFMPVIKFQELSDRIFSDLIKLYDENLGIFYYSSDDKKISFSSFDIVLYLMCLLIQCTLKDSKDYQAMLYNIFKYQLVNSGVILSWPEAPNLDDVERYKNFSLKSEDLLEEQYFIMPNISTPENTQYAPIFVKNIDFNKKKECFKQKKVSFYSETNMCIFFMLLYIHKFVKDNED
ncbi:hypothetical protein [Haloimpatiens lingqiaonensis]|uniref:hypothetical protein n=1 Tax=Haloimpatiens lingqiaonensis TaxID=1380675 RepID=UPI0010FEC853|nr:hypothetical protein [Haloimpatiens lingqiaonensis]